MSILSSPMDWPASPVYILVLAIIMLFRPLDDLLLPVPGHYLLADGPTPALAMPILLTPLDWCAALVVDLTLRVPVDCAQ